MAAQYLHSHVADSGAPYAILNDILNKHNILLSDKIVLQVNDV